MANRDVIKPATQTNSIKDAKVATNENSLSQLQSCPIKIYIKDIKNAIAQCSKLQTKKNVFAKLAGAPALLKQLQSFLKTLDPDINKESTRLLVEPAHDPSTPLNDNQLYELAKLLIPHTGNGSKLNEGIANLQSLFNLERFSALFRLVSHGSYLTLLSFDNFKLICEFDPKNADFAARLVLCVLRHAYSTDEHLLVKGLMIPDSQNKEELQKAQAWQKFLSAFYYHNESSIYKWCKENLKIFINFAIQCPVQHTEKIANAMYLAGKCDLCSHQEVRDYFLAHPEQAARVSSGLVWLSNRGIYNEANQRKLFECPARASHLKLIGESKLETDDQDKVLNQMMFEQAILRADQQRQIIWQFFRPDAKPEGTDVILDTINSYLLPQI